MRFLPFMLLALPLSAATYYVSPSGSGTSMSVAAPGELFATITNHVAGDSIYLLTGTYAFDTNKSVVLKSNVTFAGLSGQYRPTLSNYPVCTANGTIQISTGSGYCSVSNLVIMSQYGGLGTPTSPGAFIINGTNALIVDVTVTRCGMAFPVNGAHGQFLHVVGAITYNNGTNTADHNYYVQNSDVAKPKIFEHGLAFRTAGFNSQIYSSICRGVEFRNYAYWMSSPTVSRDVLIRGDDVDDGIVIATNCFWSGSAGWTFITADNLNTNKGSIRLSSNFGWGGAAYKVYGFTNVVITNNWLVDSHQTQHADLLTNYNRTLGYNWNYNTYGPLRTNSGVAFRFSQWLAADLDFTSLQAWTNATGLDINSIETSTRPAGVTNFVWKHPLRDKTGMVVVYNFPSNDVVSVDLSSLGMVSGDRYYVLYGGNPLGNYVRTNLTYTGAAITLPMTNLVDDIWTSNTMINTNGTLPEFGVFLIVPPTHYLVGEQAPAGIANASFQTLIVQ